MKLSTFKNTLSKCPDLCIALPDGSLVPPHFHLTEVGWVSKRFIDCGGTVRDEGRISFQLWTADDLDHRLSPAKALRIIEEAEKHLDLPDLEVEVEYQTDTIGKYGLSHAEGCFHLVPTETDCLAKEKCGLPQVQPIAVSASCCDPQSGCC